jgi:hypothetical protein
MRQSRHLFFLSHIQYSLDEMESKAKEEKVGIDVTLYVMTRTKKGLGKLLLRSVWSNL